jgi:protein-L-isoaspartate O-methyltransferase
MQSVQVIGSHAKAALKRSGKQMLLAAMALLTRRHPVLLPANARSDRSLFRLCAPYRVEDGVLTVRLEEPGPGHLTAELLGYLGHIPARRIWRGHVANYAGPCDLTLRFSDGRVFLAERPWGQVQAPLTGRRFCWRLTLRDGGNVRRERLTGHYLPAEGRALDAAYFHGDNYVDHEAESAADHARIQDILHRQGARGPVLEIGCATGGLLSVLDAMGLETVGVDASPWAVEQANARLGSGRVYLCDVEHEALPSEVLARGPFRCLVLWAVLEHFREPFAVLAKLTHVAESGALLFINTTNKDSLTHALFGAQWEGHFDWTHLGVDKIGVCSLREELPSLGWCIEQLTTDLIWDRAADPIHATVRDWWAADARFRRLLAERELGDLITCLAVKR